MIVLPVALFSEMLDQARREAPVEACGYLAGRGRRVARLFPMTNADHSPVHFSFLPEEQLRVVRVARAAGLRLLGCYHSHPAGPPRPSAEDLALARDPAAVYLIVSLLPGHESPVAFRKTGPRAEAVAVFFCN